MDTSLANLQTEIIRLSRQKRLMRLRREIKKEETKQSAKSKKKRLEFSQRMTLVSAIFSMLIVIAVHSANFMLLWNDRQPMAQETISTVTIYGGITSTLTLGGYFALTGVRNCSVNKHGKADEVGGASVI